MNNIRQNPNGDKPIVDPTAYIDPTARVIGNVKIGPRVYVGPYAVIRADESDTEGNVLPIEIAAESNIQDAVIIHALGGSQVKIGTQTSLAHGCIVHGPCTIGNNCFIGFKAVVYNATVPDESFISTTAIVQSVNLPQNALVPLAVTVTSEDDITNHVTTAGKYESDFNKKVVIANLTLAKGYLALNQ